MKKTGAGLLCAGLVLIAGSVWADEAMQIGEAPVVAPEAGSSNRVEDSSAKKSVAARLDEVKALPLGELKEKLAETEASLPALNDKLADAGRAAQDARTTVAENSSDIKELYMQIRALHDRIAALTETLPEVQEKVAEQTAIRGKLLSEMEFRTKLTGLIRQREAAEAATANTEELP